MYTYAPCVLLVPTDIRNVSDSLEIELEMVVSNHAGAGKMNLDSQEQCKNSLNY